MNRLLFEGHLSPPSIFTHLFLLMPKNIPPIVIIIAIDIPTIPKNGVSGIRVNISAANAAYNPITDQYMKLKWRYFHLFTGLLVQIGIIPAAIVKTLTIVV